MLCNLVTKLSTGNQISGSITATTNEWKLWYQLFFIITVGNETFQGRLKSCLADDDTVIRCAGSLDKFVLGEIIGSNLVK